MKIGACVTHWVIESSDLMTQQKTPGLDQIALQIGDVHVRNRGTIVEFCYTLIQGLIIRELSWRLKPPMSLKNQQGNVQLIRLFFYQALGNRSWRK